MKQDLDDLLCQRYPDIFRDRHGHRMNTLMCYGFACGDGWFDLLDHLCKQISDAVEAGAPQVVAVQVKEKFGTLRFYHSGGDAVTNALIDAAMAQSAHVCEQCGATPASMSALGGIYRVRCAGCYSTLRKEQGAHVFDFCSAEDIGPALLSHRQRVVEAFVDAFGMDNVKAIWAKIEADQAPEKVRQVRAVLGTIAKKLEEHASEQDIKLAELKLRGSRAKMNKALEILDRVPHVKPDAGDEPWD